MKAAIFFVMACILSLMLITSTNLNAETDTTVTASEVSSLSTISLFEIQSIAEIDLRYHADGGDFGGCNDCMAQCFFGGDRLGPLGPCVCCDPPLSFSLTSNCSNDKPDNLVEIESV